MQDLYMRQDAKQSVRGVPTSLDFEEEYHRVLRTKSYADFFSRAHLLASQPSIFSNQNKFLEILLEPSQETIHSIIDATNLSKTPELKNLILSYFEISVEASLIYCYLLKTINQVQCNYHFIEMDDVNDSPTKAKQIIFHLSSFDFSNGPFSELNTHEFKLISDKQSLVLHSLTSMREKVGKKVKLMTYLKETSETCVKVACSLVPLTTNVIATHILMALIMRQTFLGFPCAERLERKLPHLWFSRRFLSKVCDQLDIASKGNYILHKDFDTMSTLVARLCDEVEHNKVMVQLCLDKNDDKLSLQIVKELKKGDVGFRRLVEELKEHVYLCLVNINRARCLVIKEMA
ncbi:hypothetical protein Fmac_016139 [Flemingia macrophylla]|uniref:Uncharacterized protein n=1 Tax=Flemingia macrophylla TaxID=520843 RepID=A0ABD1MGK3_9FABA